MILCPSCGRQLNVRRPFKEFVCTCNARFEITPSQTVKSKYPGQATLRVPCVHLGNEIRRESCDTCNGKVQIKIFGCEIHGECSLARRQSVKFCGTCTDYTRYRKPSPGTIRVGFVSPSFAFPGGVQEWIISLAMRLALDEAVFCSGLAIPNLEAAEENVSRFELVAPVLMGSESIPALAAVSDVLIVSGMGSVKQMLRNSPCKIILTLHGACSWTDKFAKQAGPTADRVVGVSEAACSLWPGSQLIANGVELDRCVPLDSERGILREPWGLKPDQRALGYIGRLAGDKDPLAVARAVKALGSNWKAVFCGSDLEGMLAQAHAMVPGRVVYIPPLVRIAPVLGSLDCLMMVSRHEGFCLALTEAWAAGVPTVVTAVGGVPEVEAKFGQVAFSVPFQAPPNELARAVEQITSVGMAEIVERARYAAQSYYNADRMAAEWVELIREVCGATVQP